MIRTLASTTALSLVLVAQGAFAEVTPAEVWANWQALATSAGQEITFDNVAESGDAVEVTGLLITYTDDLGGSFSASIDKVTFAGQWRWHGWCHHVGKLSDDPGLPGRG